MDAKLFAGVFPYMLAAKTAFLGFDALNLKYKNRKAAISRPQLFNVSAQ